MDAPSHSKDVARPNNLTDDIDFGLLAPASRGERLIIVREGGREGFISNALSKQKPAANRNEMGGKNYGWCLKATAIQNLPPNSILVIEKARSKTFTQKTSRYLSQRRTK
jgi:hypothetical protein